jgi:Xaa-Pro aminopeptidase
MLRSRRKVEFVRGNIRDGCLQQERAVGVCFEQCGDLGRRRHSYPRSLDVDLLVSLKCQESPSRKAGIVGRIAYIVVHISLTSFLMIRRKDGRMVEVISNPDSLLLETGIDFREVGVLTHTFLDAARSIRPLLIVNRGERYLIAHSVDKAAIGHANPKNVRAIFYGGWFSFDDLILGSSDEKSLEGALLRSLRGASTAVVTTDISVTYYRHLSRLLKTEVRPHGLDGEVYAYEISRDAVLERFGAEYPDAATSAVRVFARSRVGELISRYIERRVDLRFAGLSEALWEAGADAFLMSSPPAVQDVSGITMSECERVQAVAITGHEGPIIVLCREPLAEVSPDGQYQDLATAAKRYLPTGVVGIEPDDLCMGVFTELGLGGRQVQFSTQLIRAWRERRAVDELAFYAVLARAQVFAIENALDGVREVLEAGLAVTEAEVESRYWNAVNEFARRHDLPFKLEKYFVDIFTSDHVFPASPSQRRIPRETKTIRFDAALLAVDKLGLVRANSDSSRHLVFTPEGNEFAATLEYLARELVMPRVRPGVTGEDVWRMGVQYLESQQQRWERLGLMPLGSPPLSSFYDRDTGHMFAKQTRPSLMHTKGCKVPVRAGMVGTIEYVWPYNGYIFGLEDTFFDAPGETVNLSDGG